MSKVKDTKKSSKNDSPSTPKMTLSSAKQQEFIATLTDEQKTLLKGLNLDEFITYDTSLPKRPLTGFFLYADTIRDEIRKKHPELRVTEHGPIFSERWKALDDATREKFNKNSQDALEAYKAKAAKLQVLAELKDRCIAFYKAKIGIVDEPKFPVVDGISWDTSLAMAGTKRLMSLDPDVGQLSKDAVQLTSRATEAFIVYLGKSLAKHLRSTSSKKKTLTLKSFVQMVYKDDELKFLRALPILAELRKNKNFGKEGDDEDKDSMVDSDGNKLSASAATTKSLQQLQMKHDELETFLQSQKKLAKFVTQDKDAARDIFEDLDDSAPTTTKKSKKSKKDTDGDATEAKEKKPRAKKATTDEDKKKAPADNALVKAINKSATEDATKKKSKKAQAAPAAAATYHQDDDDEDLFDDIPFTPSKPKSTEKKRRITSSSSSSSDESSSEDEAPVVHKVKKSKPNGNGKVKTKQ